jgi:hypothetical protein
MRSRDGYNGMLKSEYLAVHGLKRKFDGPASNQRCVDCGEPAAHWTYVHGSDPWSPNSYVPRCVGCHRYYDLGNSERRNFVVAQRNAGRTYSSIADELGVNCGTVWWYYHKEIERREMQRRRRREVRHRRKLQLAKRRREAQVARKAA